ncbi:hypothetical protein VE02_09668 [Pseudogymnoascus sp. 03VT05]|nr:hypothetical protein VE02_09668 [Pseudogymnoascus sp. 03VT05]
MGSAFEKFPNVGASPSLDTAKPLKNICSSSIAMQPAMQYGQVRLLVIAISGIARKASIVRDRFSRISGMSGVVSNTIFKTSFNVSCTSDQLARTQLSAYLEIPFPVVKEGNVHNEEHGPVLAAHYFVKENITQSIGNTFAF